MRRFSILFIVLGLISISSLSSRAQTRGIGAGALVLDDGHGHTVTITIPTMTGPGPYFWTLPITPGGTSIVLPVGSTPNSTLYWNGTAWTENTNFLATSSGVLTLGSGSNATTLTSTATSARAISFPNRAGTLGLSGGGATYQTPSPSSTNPTGTTSTTPVQMGLAGSITPATSGKVLIIVSGWFWNNTAVDGGETGLSYGTGVAPTNGVAATGTVLSTTYFYEPSGTLTYAPFSTNYILTGLTVGTAYWIDLQLEALAGGTASVNQVSISAMEMP